MPWSTVKRKCPRAGCNELVSKGRCPPHQAEADAVRAEQRKSYWRDRAESNPVYALYSSPRWKELRSRHLAANPRCVVCGGPANTVDHVYPHLGVVDRFWNGPFQSMCSKDHARKTAKEDGGFGNKRKEQA